MGFSMPRLKIPSIWSFDSRSIADNFDSHVREQLPWYDLATGIAAHIGRHYLCKGGRAYDLGASTGNIGRALKVEIEARGVEWIPVDNSAAMVANYRGPGKPELADLESLAIQPYNFAVAFLVAAFIDPATRRERLAEIAQQCRPNGALLIFDKMEPGRGYAATVLWRLALAGKLRQGASAEAILGKELSLAGVQRPLRRDELPGGAVQVFQFGDFAGWIIEA